MALPDGYDTVLGQDTALSGGQEQRIAIARAILKDAPILILDEATSAADPENQALIDQAIESLCEGKTVLVVAHRLDVVDGCDAVAVMEDGRITCVGAHDDVLGRSPYYRSAWAAWTRSRSMSYRVGTGVADGDATDGAGTVKDADARRADDALGDPNKKEGPSHA